MAAVVLGMCYTIFGILDRVGNPIFTGQIVKGVLLIVFGTIGCFVGHRMVYADSGQISDIDPTDSDSQDHIEERAV